ncbi:hypothetical protein FHR24_000070 [Wenyingzhuangia heitensis]|uniref:Uncharacterized protein n=1 Tax=Wenyingzhuangia heitensis TaxID=1487859 RepID=A0ABX0U7Y8_9FLAO|nr:hypothetical protein [Wenyingzhuangia heitensis]NIJ43631.1 hypothetical protein [Wenyingzhuangia heitensis]
MKKLFAKLKGKSLLSYDNKGVNVVTSLKRCNVVEWSKINKIVFVGHFEEYSGYFLTEEYKTKALYNDIYTDCSQNMLKIRTGGTPTVKNNTSKPFSRKFGTTCVYYAVFVEYLTDEGDKNLFAVHYDADRKAEIVKELERFLNDKKIFVENRIEGFNYIADL